MSRRPDRLRSPLQRLRPAEADGGFSLIEVMVAMVLFAVIAVASLSFIMSALKATSLARLESVAKNVGQERLESMRNLRFSVSNTVDTSPDLLDSYYPSSTATATTSATSGFVGALSLALRDTSKGDPASGGFYRTVVAPGAVPGYPTFSQRIATQFLTNDGAVLNAATFNASSTGVDALPPAQTVGVTVTTLWTAGDTTKRSSVYSQITNGAPRAPIVTLQARVAALTFSGVMSASRETSTEAAILNLDGSITSSTTATAQASSGFTSIAGGGREDGAQRTVTAPPNAGAVSSSVGTRTLYDGARIVGRLSNSAVSAVAARTDSGQPGAGTATSPVTSTVYGGGFGTLALSAGNAPSTTGRLQLLGDSVVKLDSPSCGGSCAAIQSQGYLASQGGGTHFAAATLSSTVNGTVQVLPTQFAPAGLLQLTLANAGFSCEKQAGLPAAATITYSATVRWMTYDPGAGLYAYSPPVTLRHDNGSDPLGGINLAATQVGVDAAGLPLYLADYLQQWSSLTSTSIASVTQASGDARTVSASVPGVVTLTTTALRDEADSTAGLALAAGSCVAGDQR